MHNYDSELIQGQCGQMVTALQYKLTRTLMNQHYKQHEPVTRSNNTSLFIHCLSLPGILLISMFFSGSLFGSTVETTIANPQVINSRVINSRVINATSATGQPRQATLTVDDNSSIHTYAPDTKTTPGPASNLAPATADRLIASYNPNLWIFDISLHLNSDYDHDGHYSSFSLTLDLDTTLTATTVYAVLYLANEGGPWIEYAVTGNFTINGSGSADSFLLQAELDRGYPSGYYDHYIEIYDAYTHDLAGYYGPEDSHQLFALPIESLQHDDAIRFSTDISLSFSGTGAIGSDAAGPVPLLLLAAVALIRRRVKAISEALHSNS